MRFLTIAGLLGVAAMGLTGCVTSTTAAWRTAQGHREVRVVSTTTGLIWGPCIPSPGSVATACDFWLVGERDVYTEKDFSAFSELPSGARFPLTVERGTIAIDRTRHRITLDLTIAGKPFALNGQFALVEGEEPARRPAAP